LNLKQGCQPFYREVMSFLVTAHGVVSERGEFSLKEEYPLRVLEFLISAQLKNIWIFILQNSA